MTNPDTSRDDNRVILDPREVATLDEAAWYRDVYRPAEPQLTVRAIATGLLLGFVFSFANVYIGLKAGWFFSMALAAILVSVASWRGLAAIGAARTPLSVLETSCMQSTASSAAYATGNMVVGVIPALLLLSVSPAHPAGEQRSPLALAAWIACIAALGVVLAIPLKRQLIDRERLAFPSGTAAAVMLHGLARAAGSVRAQARLMFAAVGGGALLAVGRDLLGWIPASSRVFGQRASEHGLVLDHSVLLIAAGAFVGLRVAAWMVVGGAITAFGLGPLAIDAGAATHPALAWLEVGLWLGTPLLVAHATVSLLANWRAFARLLAPRAGDPPSAIQIPMRWFWRGFALTGAAAVALGQALFDIPIALGVLAVAMSLVFSAVACRITGETDVTPGGAMGKLTQLTFGMLRPEHPSTNLVTASMTHASSVASADLLNDLKAGYLLGADPRKQFWAQLVGIVAGTAASVTAYFILVPDARALLGESPAFAAPGAHQFQAIALLMQHGLDALHPLLRWLVVIGAGAGVALSLGERRLRWFSAAGLGLGLLLPISSSVAMLIGAVIAAVAAERVVWPIAAGALAGESLAGVIVTLVQQL